MNLDDVYWVYVVPVYIVGLLSVIDVIRRRDLPGMRKAGWIALLVLFTPLTLIYLLARPVGDVIDRLDSDLDPADPREQLVTSVEELTDGVIDESTYSGRLLELRPHLAEQAHE
jgi:hypothetical protein